MDYASASPSSSLGISTCVTCDTVNQRDLELIKRRFPVSEAVARRSLDAPRLPSARPERTEGSTLVRPPSRKKKSSHRIVRRHQVTYRIFAVRPVDWDNAFIKGLQDLLVTAGLLPGDAWHQLYGTVISEKVSTAAEEKTVISITPCQNP